MIVDIDNLLNLNIYHDKWVSGLKYTLQILKSIFFSKFRFFFGTFACLTTMTIIPFQNNFLTFFFLSMDSLCGNSNPHTLQLSVNQVRVVKTGS